MHLFSVNVGGGGGSGPGTVLWGQIGGTLSDQLDLQAALNAKQNTLTFPLTIAQGGTNSNTALNNNRIMISTGGAIKETAALTAGRIVYTDSNGLPIISGVGIAIPFGINDPVIFGVNSLNFRCPGAAGLDALGIGSAGDVLLGASGRKLSPDAAGTNIDLGATGTRFRDLFLKGALFVTAGANQICGTATLVGGTVTVSNTRITASSLIFLTRNTPGGVVGDLSLGTISAGTSFVINSAVGTDTSTVNWFFIN